jgi:hypothetical protein
MEESGLSGPIGSDQSDNFTSEDIETNIVDSLKPTKGSSEAVYGQDGLTAVQRHPLETWNKTGKIYSNR